MDPLYPEPPHLTVAVYPDRTEERCFAGMCEVMEELDCGFQGVVEVAPWDASFEFRSDLAGVASTMEVTPDRFRQIVAGRTGPGRPVRAGYSSKLAGVVVIGYGPAPSGDAHPIMASMHAGALGIPMELWSGRDRSAAARLARWTTDALARAVARCEAPYGGIGVEFSLPTPAELRAGTASLASEVFVSRDLLDSDADLDAALTAAVSGGGVTPGPGGTFYSGWAPYNDRNQTVPDLPARLRRAGARLGRAVARRR